MIIELCLLGAGLSSVAGLYKYKHNKQRKETAIIFKNLDKDGNGELTMNELAEWVKSNGQLWAMLAVNLNNLSEEKCQSIALGVIIELASGKVDGEKGMDSEITEKQLHDFRTKYLLDAKGNQEFFHRCVFKAFDEDGNQYLDEQEIDNFLNVFYESDSIFKGDARLPPRNELRKFIYEKLDENNDKKLELKEIRSLITGSAIHKVSEAMNKVTEKSLAE